MTLFELKDQCNDLIGKGDFEGTFGLLERHLDPGRKVFNDVVLLKGRHSLNLDNEMRGLATREESQVEYTRIAASLQRLANELQQADLGNGGKLVELLDAIVAGLPVDVALTPLHLVNCNRRKPTRTFWSAFDSFLSENKRFQYYLILACPTQEPEGFSERAVYELLEKELENEHQSIDFRRRADERLRIEPMPLGHNLMGCQRAFKKYFSERFGLTNADTAFEDYLQTGLPKLPWQYVATVFKVTATDWDQAVMAPYLQWLMDNFSHTGPNIPTFLFFFVVTVKMPTSEEAVSRDNREALDGARVIAEAHQGRAILIEPLPPVPVDDLEDWLEKLGDITDITKMQIIDLLAQRLTTEELNQFQQFQFFNMERIEDFQEKIYRHHHHK
ncbi:MAG: hypothetical protein IPN33_17220 [Saprospiraceae bacterium]|nr:hypothetical protein [Saprospiraceae bacterium]